MKRALTIIGVVVLVVAITIPVLAQGPGTGRGRMMQGCGPGEPGDCPRYRASDDKLTDDQFKAVVVQDPFFAEALRYIGDLTRDGRMPQGEDAHREIEAKVPIQPKCPELYVNRPANDPERLWFSRNGVDWAKRTWNGVPF
jgi:hypothetical protein